MRYFLMLIRTAQSTLVTLNLRLMKSLRIPATSGLCGVSTKTSNQTFQYRCRNSSSRQKHYPPLKPTMPFQLKGRRRILTSHSTKFINIWSWSFHLTLFLMKHILLSTNSNMMFLTPVFDIFFVGADDVISIHRHSDLPDLDPNLPRDLGTQSLIVQYSNIILTVNIIYLVHVGGHSYL